jgi:hypothetical protein
MTLGFIWIEAVRVERLEIDLLGRRDVSCPGRAGGRSYLEPGSIRQSVPPMVNQYSFGDPADLERLPKNLKRDLVSEDRQEIALLDMIAL